jgi:hypothetical protein
MPSPVPLREPVAQDEQGAPVPPVAEPPVPLPSEVSPGLAVAAAPVVPTDPPTPGQVAPLPLTEPVPLEEEVPTGPRVLLDEAQAAREAAERDARIQALEEQDAAEAVPEARQRTGARTGKQDVAAAVDTGAVQTLSTDPADFGTPADRKAVWRTAERLKKEAEKAAKPLDKDWSELLTLKGAVRGRGPKAAAANARWLELRQAIAGKAQAAPPQTRGIERVRAKRKEAVESEATKARNIVTSVEYSDDVRRGKPEAMRAYIRDLVKQAVDAGIKIPAKRRHRRGASAPRSGQGRAEHQEQHSADRLHGIGLRLA